MTTFDAFADAKEYRFNKIVLVHSASAAYIELPIDTSCAILGGNNNGKTSLLHAFLLFLLPEVNFNECEKKFGFQSNGQVHTGIDSFNYYFPSRDSYIILEATNPKHTFCIVLHQSKEQLGYGRIAVAKPYAEIEHLFWDKQSPANGGEGAPCFDIGFADVQKALLDLGGAKQTQRSDLREQLYNRVQVGRSDTQYCLVPLGNVSDSSIAALKTLLQLSAGLLPKGNGLAKAVASVISSSMSSSKDKSEIDFERIQEEREELRDKQDHIQKLKNNKLTWDDLTSEREKYRALKTKVTNDLSTLFQKALNQQAYHRAVITENGERLQSIGAEAERLREEKRPIVATLEKVKSDFGVITGQIKVVEEQVKRAEDSIASTTPVAQSSHHQAIIKYLAQYQKDCEERLDDLQNIDSARSRLQANLNRQKAINTRIGQLEALLTTDKSLLDELDSRTSGLIYSINTNFGNVPALKNAEVIEACQHFASALGRENEQLTVGGAAIPNTYFAEHNAEAIRLKRQEEIKTLDKEYEQLKQQITKDKRFLQGSEADQNNERREIEEEIQGAKADISSIYSFEENSKKLQANREELELLTLNRDELTVQIEALDDAIDAQKQLHTKTQREAKDSQLANSLLDNTLSTLDRYWHNLTNGVFNHTPQSTPSTSNDAEAINKEVHILDQALSKDLHSGRAYCIGLLRKLAMAEIVSGIDDVHYVEINSGEFQEAYNRLHTEFHNLDMYEKELSDKIKKHNANTSREISLLEQINGGIEAFTNEINQSFAGVQVSNLQSVELRVQKHEGFVTLIGDVARFRTDMDSLASDSFYDRLRNFSDRYLQKGGRKGLLDIESIVTGVEYIYGFDGRKEKTQQSNGTTIMINTVVLSILIDKLTSGDLRMRMPVIFDEAAAIDEKNLPALHGIVNRVGLTLLAATPHFQMHIGNSLGHWHYLFDHKVVDTEQVGDKCTTIYYKESEYLKRIEPLQQDKLEETEKPSLMVESGTV
ncbi:hypothetical protein [uncultured Endozoicomonas sp.]|uniref:hypothetical protein n=1 Tax=uncultured Endozoicomonas sp. TaxID=432652 RepID=UPI0026089DBA|nr:hypothetical protein [uncultured Endozoicomonas sp.]